MGNPFYRISIFMRRCGVSALRALEVVGTCIAIAFIGVLMLIDFIFGD